MLSLYQKSAPEKLLFRMPITDSRKTGSLSIVKRYINFYIFIIYFVHKIHSVFSKKQISICQLEKCCFLFLCVLYCLKILCFIFNKKYYILRRKVDLGFWSDWVLVGLDFGEVGF